MGGLMGDEMVDSYGHRFIENVRLAHRVYGGRFSHAPIPIRVAGKDEDLEFGGKRAQQVKDSFLTNRIGVYKNIVEDEDLGFVAGKFLGYGDAEAEEKLLAGTLGKTVEWINRLAGAAEPGNLKVVVQKDLSACIRSQICKSRGEALFQRSQDGFGCGLFPEFDQVMGDTGRPSEIPGGVPAKNGFRFLFLQFGFAGVDALTAQHLQCSVRAVAFGTSGLEFVRELLESGGGAPVSLGEFFKIRRKTGLGRGNAGLGLGELDLSFGFGRINPLWVTGTDIGNLGFKRFQEGAIFARFVVGNLDRLGGLSLLGSHLSELTIQLFEHFLGSRDGLGQTRFLTFQIG
jgi:hypothetical protein